MNGNAKQHDKTPSSTCRSVLYNILSFLFFISSPRQFSSFYFFPIYLLLTYCIRPHTSVFNFTKPSHKRRNTRRDKSSLQRCFWGCRSSREWRRIAAWEGLPTFRSNVAPSSSGAKQSALIARSLKTKAVRFFERSGTSHPKYERPKYSGEKISFVTGLPKNKCDKNRRLATRKSLEYPGLEE